MPLFEELRRRGVLRTSFAYLLVAWMIVQVVDIVLGATGGPGWVMLVLIGSLGLGLVPVAIFSWAYEITPQGIQREADVDRSGSWVADRARRMNLTIIAIVLLSTALFVAGHLSGEREATIADRDSTGDDLTAAAPPAPSGGVAIAVLPLANLSPDPDQDYFADGISEELLNVLAQVPGLRVAARTSSFQFKGENRDIAEIARTLRVDHVVEGSVRRAGDQLRIAVQLVNASTGYRVWSESYDRELDDVFVVQDEIAQAIGRALERELGLDTVRLGALPRVPEAASPAAYEAFLHGRFLLNQRGNRAIREAVAHLESALRLDPNYAPAHAQLAIALTLLRDSPTSYGDLSLAEVNAAVPPHIDAAMALDPELPEAWGATAQLAWSNGRYDEALAAARRALELNPVYVDAINWTNGIQLAIGDYAGSEATLERLLEVDPLSVVGRLNYITSIMFAELPRARQMSRELVEDYAWAGYLTSSFVPYIQGDLAESVRWLLLAYAEDPQDRATNQLLVRQLASVGLDAEAERVADATRHLAALVGGRPGEAAELAAAELSRDPTNRPARAVLAEARYRLGDFPAAVEHFDAALDPARGLIPPQHGFYTDGSTRYAFVLRAVGREQAAMRVGDRIAADLAGRAASKQGADPLYGRDLALHRALTGDFDAALEQLEVVVASGNHYARHLDEPLLAPLAGEPRFEALAAAHEARVRRAREAVRALICEDNPIPASWRPLPMTCEPQLSAEG